MPDKSVLFDCFPAANVGICIWTYHWHISAYYCLWLHMFGWVGAWRYKVRVIQYIARHIYYLLSIIYKYIIYYLLSIIYYLLSIINYLLSFIYYLLSIIYYLLSIIYYLLSIIYYLLSIIYYLFCIIYSLLSTGWVKKNDPLIVSNFTALLLVFKLFKVVGHSTTFIRRKMSGETFLRT